MPVRGIRGATTLCEDTPEAIRLATRELLLAICAANPSLRPVDIASVFFTTTEDIMTVRGIRGATTVCEDDAEAIRLATRELLVAISAANPTLRPADIASAFFTTTDDLRAAYPAQAARELGWEEVPLMCAQEIPVPGSLRCCIRVMILWNTDLAQNEVHHIYLRDAIRLRPDLARTSFA